MAMGLVALAALLALLGAFGWDLTGAREGSKAPVGTVTTVEGARKGGAPEAPEGSREGRPGKGVGSGIPSVDLAGGTYMPASPSVSATASASPASASAPASASPDPATSGTGASGPWASNPRASGTWGSGPPASSPTPGGSSGSGGRVAGTTSAGAVESAAQGQYR